MTQRRTVTPVDEMNHKLSVFKNITNAVIAMRRAEILKVRLEIEHAKLEILWQKHDSKSASSATAPEIGKLGPRAEAAIPGLMAMLDQDTERALALAALKSIKVRSVPDLLKLLGMRESKVRVFACDSLGALGPAAKEAAPKLHDLLSASSPVQEAARKALAKIETQ